MFNRGGFNALPFNRTATLSIYGSFTADMQLNVEMIGRMEMHGGFESDMSADVLFNAVSEKLGAFALHLDSEIDLTGMRERTGSFNLAATLNMTVNAGRTHVDTIEFTGAFAPGDKIVIDSSTLKMTLNGENALHLMDGDFFNLNTGSNEITYTDDKLMRSVRIRVTHKDKFAGG